MLKKSLRGEESERYIMNMSLHTTLTPEAQERLRKQKTTSLVTSFVISFLTVALIGLLLALLMIAIPQQEVETIVSYQAPQVEDAVDSDQPQVEVNQRQVPTPPTSSASVANVIASTSVSSVAIPDSDTFTQFESVDFGEVDDFSEDSGFGDEQSSESSMFGSPVNGSRICYVIDYSASMKYLGRDKLMREELAKSVKLLKGGADFNLIFFASPAWEAGDTIQGTGRGLTVIEDSEGKKWNWKGKPKYDIKNNDGRKSFNWRKPTGANINEAVKQIRDTPLIFGTSWISPLRYAINMKPRPQMVIFMTDGMGGSVKDLVKIAETAKKRGVVVSSISLIEPKAAEAMKALAKTTGGTATLVKKDKTVIDLFTGKSIIVK